MTDGSLTKAVLIKEVAHAAGLTKKRAEIIVEHRARQHRGDAALGRERRLRGCGSFRLRNREPHTARNPRTGDRMDVASKRIAYFKPGKELKELLRDPAQPAPPPLSE